VKTLKTQSNGSAFFQALLPHRLTYSQAGLHDITLWRITNKSKGVTGAKRQNSISTGHYDCTVVSFDDSNLLHLIDKYSIFSCDSNQITKLDAIKISKRLNNDLYLFI